MINHRFRAFTLVELLVVMGIVGIVASLVIPAIQATREAARRVQCGNNLRQLGLAMHNYEASFACLPPGRIKSYDIRFSGPNPRCNSTIIDKGLEVFLLPYLEQAAVFDAINQSLTIFGAENQTVHVVSVAQYSCPSDPLAGRMRDLNANALTEYGLADPPAGRQQMISTSYAGCTGSFEALALPLPSNSCRPPSQGIAQNNGCFNDLSPITLAAITDGLSNTLFLVERSTSALQRLQSEVPQEFAKHGWFISGNWGDTLATTFYPPNAYKSVVLSAFIAQFNSPSSLHRGGLCVLMGDGSMHFVKETVNSWPFNPLTGIPNGAVQNSGGWWADLPRPGVWQALATRASGESVGVDSL